MTKAMPRPRRKSKKSGLIERIEDNLVNGFFGVDLENIKNKRDYMNAIKRDLENMGYKVAGMHVRNFYGTIMYTQNEGVENA